MPRSRLSLLITRLVLERAIREQELAVYLTQKTLDQYNGTPPEEELRALERETRELQRLKTWLQSYQEGATPCSLTRSGTS